MSITEVIFVIFLILAAIVTFTAPERPWGFACLCVAVAALGAKVFGL
jgi:hypothetical protein